MIVGAALVELHVHGSHSLKQKRGVVRSIVSRVRSRYNVSVAEVGGQDTWQRAVLGVAVTGLDARSVRRTLDRVVDYVESLHLAEVRASDVEILDLPYAESVGDGDDTPLPWEEE
jgi:uncharacterized protein YlxP (DUF503 family)